MKIGPINIELAKTQPKEAPKKTKDVIIKYPSPSQSQVFAGYRNVKGSQMLSFELIDGLYENTVMNRVVQKIAGDSTRMNYSVNYIGMDGTREDTIADVGVMLDSLIDRTTLRMVFKDFLKYGTAFLYIQYDKSTNLPIRMYTLHPRYISPIFENGELMGWKYQGAGEPVLLTTTELIHFPNDPSTGEVFGSGIFGPVIQILELILNSQLNTSILIDRYAIPILHWMIESAIEGEKVDEDEITNFLNMLIDQLEIGSDVATPSQVSSKVIGMDGNLIDFIPIVENLMYTFGVTVGVPLQLMGFPGDNLSVSTRMMQAYQGYISDLQEQIGARIVESIYKPYLESQGFLHLVDYREIQISFPIMSVEEGSKTAVWLFPALQNGLISREEARNTLGFKGLPLPIDEIEIPEIQQEVVRPGARQPSDPEDPPKPQEPNEEDRKR